MSHRPKNILNALIRIGSKRETGVNGAGPSHIEDNWPGASGLSAHMCHRRNLGSVMVVERCAVKRWRFRSRLGHISSSPMLRCCREAGPPMSVQIVYVNLTDRGAAPRTRAATFEALRGASDVPVASTGTTTSRHGRRQHLSKRRLAPGPISWIALMGFGRGPGVTRSSASSPRCGAAFQRTVLRPRSGFRLTRSDIAEAGARELQHRSSGDLVSVPRTRFATGPAPRAGAPRRGTVSRCSADAKSCG